MKKWRTVGPDPLIQYTSKEIEEMGASPEDGKRIARAIYSMNEHEDLMWKRARKYEETGRL